MPFTPFHMGPALAVKALAPRSFSVLMFGLAQVAMDIEPGLGLLFGWEILHGWTHTYLGAVVIGAVVLLLGRPLAAAIERRWNAELRAHELGWLAEPRPLGWIPAAAGAFIGTLSHAALDSLMHADMRPLAPFSPANNLLAAISLPTLHLACTALGAIGILCWAARGIATKGRAGTR